MNAIQKQLDVLMGMNRNGDVTEVNRKYYDRDVCRLFLSGLCPHELFQLTNASKDLNEQLEYLRAIKSAITFSDVISIVVVSMLEKPLENLECKEFSDDDSKLVQLVLTLIRNMLAVQDISGQQTTTVSANLFLLLRDNFLEKLFQEKIIDVITVITQHVNGSSRYMRHDTLLLLEIYRYIFVGQDPELIVKARLEDSKVKGDTRDCLESLKSIRQEAAEKRKVTRLHASRHSHFSGAFTLK